MTRWPRIVAAAVALALAACVAQGPLVEGVDASGRRLVLVLDRSTSMRDNDPGDAARSGVDLALALAGARDNVGVVTFAEDPRVVVALRPAGGTAAREAARQALAGIERHGVSDVGRALERAREMLEAGGAPAGSPIVFLTDGVPYRQARGRRLADGPSVDEAVAAIARKGYRIFAIALGRGASTPFLSRLVASTGGAVVVARDPAELVAAFETVAVEALGYLRAERGDALTALPHTRRLAFLGRWEGAGRVGVVTRDDAPVEEAALVRTPSGGGGPFSVALVEGPEAGAWKADLQGARETVLLLEPGFAIDLGPGTPPVVASGGAVPVTVALQGDPALIAQAREGLRLRARVEREAGGGDGAWTTLEPGVAASLVAPQVREETAARVVVEAQVTLAGRAFELRRTRALTVQVDGEAPAAGPVAEAAPATPLALTVRPRTFTRLVWQGDPLDPVRLTVRGDPTRAVAVRCGGRSLELAAGGVGMLEVPCPDDGALRVTAEAEGAPPFELDLQGTVRRYRLGLERVSLPATPAGVAARPQEVSVALEASTDAPARAVLAPGDLQLEGPSGHVVPVERTEAGWVARPPADTPPGPYRGLAVVVVEEPRGLRSREVPVELEVLAPVRAPGAVTVHGAWGWVSRPIEVAWPTLDEVPVTIAPGPLAGVGATMGATIRPELDIRVVPLDGWSGETLSHEPRRFALQVFLSSDLPAGVYHGAVEVAVEGQAVSIPVELEVRR